MFKATASPSRLEYFASTFTHLTLTSNTQHTHVDRSTVPSPSILHAYVKYFVTRTKLGSATTNRGINPDPHITNVLIKNFTIPNL